MKKLISALIICISIVSTTAFAQDTFKPGSVSIALTVGPANGYGYGTGFGVATALVAQYGIKQVGPGVISAGAFLGYSARTSTGNYYYYGTYYDQTTQNIIAAGHAEYHYDWKVKKLDTYAGVATGARFQKIHYDYTGYTDDTKTYVYAGLFAGGSYYFTPVFGVNAEVGYGISFFRVGVVFKFGGGSDK